MGYAHSVCLAVTRVGGSTSFFLSILNKRAKWHDNRHEKCRAERVNARYLRSILPNMKVISIHISLGRSFYGKMRDHRASRYEARWQSRHWELEHSDKF